MKQVGFLRRENEGWILGLDATLCDRFKKGYKKLMWKGAHLYGCRIYSKLSVMRVEEKKSDHWKTNNQKYGEHASNLNSSISNLKHKCAISTLDILKINDQSGYVHQLENIAKR